MSVLQNYEIYLILNPELSVDAIEQEIVQLSSILTSELDTSSLSISKEGLKRLAYPINKHVSGFYCLATFDVDILKAKNIKNVEKKLNLNEKIVRYIIINQTDFIKQKNKEILNKVEINSHRELNKGKNVTKKCITSYMGLRVIDYKDADYLNQFTSPYAKIFGRTRTGSKAKFQRKITVAIKRARHMGLMPFTPKYSQ